MIKPLPIARKLYNNFCGLDNLKPSEMKRTKGHTTQTKTRKRILLYLKYQFEEVRLEVRFIRLTTDQSASVLCKCHEDSLNM